MSLRRCRRASYFKEAAAFFGVSRSPFPFPCRPVGGGPFRERKVATRGDLLALATTERSGLRAARSTSRFSQQTTQPATAHITLPRCTSKPDPPQTQPHDAEVLVKVVQDRPRNTPSPAECRYAWYPLTASHALHEFRSGSRHATTTESHMYVASKMRDTRSQCRNTDSIAHAPHSSQGTRSICMDATGCPTTTTGCAG